MTNQFYEPGEHRGARVKELFARIATRYDLVNDLQSFGLHRYWKRKVIDLARPKPDDRALDVCCGTGDLALLLAGRAGGVMGVDFSDRMLEVARDRSWAAAQPAASRSALSPQFIQGDALRLPFADRTFDVVTIAYGLRNLSDLKAGLSEMCRVAKPAARLVILDFGKPDNPIWRGVYFSYLKLLVPILGLIVCGSASAYSYILESLKHYPGQRGVAAQMVELGMANVRIMNFIGGAMSINYGEV